jgi:hypothetical protein
MKSIKNQYIALKEGKMTEAQFMRNVRMTLPEYISNVTLFKQAEKILMNKGIISEIKLQFSDIKKGDILTNKFSGTKYTVVEPGDKSITIQQGDDGKEVEVASLNNYELLKEAKEGYFNQDGKEQYSKFNELDNMNAQEIMAGYVMEKQDNPNIDIKEAIKTVIKNLKKDQFYYTNYKLTGIRDVKPTEFTSTKRKPFFDQMEEVDKKGTNFVDEKNKMVVVKEGLDNPSLINEAPAEDVKALIDPQTLSRLDIFDRDDETILVYDNHKTIGRDVSDGLKPVYDKYNFYKQDEGDPEGLEYVEYVLRPKSIKESNSKVKLKELVRKMMKEMFDGRDNLTAIEDVSNSDKIGELDSANLIKKYYARPGDLENKFLLSTLYSNGEATIKNVGGTVYYDYPGSFLKDLQSGKIQEVPFY